MDQALIRILMVEWAHQAFALHAVVCPPLAGCISQTSNFLNRNKHYRLLYPRDLTLVGRRKIQNVTASSVSPGEGRWLQPGTLDNIRGQLLVPSIGTALENNPHGLSRTCKCCNRLSIQTWKKTSSTVSNFNKKSGNSPNQVLLPLKQAGSGA